VGKTRRSDEESKQEQIPELKGQLKVQKKEISRLNRRIKSLEKRVDEKVTKTKKPDIVETDVRREVLDRIKKEFGK